MKALTSVLRFVKKADGRNILQQKWFLADGTEEWADVPLVEEPAASTADRPNVRGWTPYDPPGQIRRD